MSEKVFEASRYLTKLKGKDYLEVKWRLLWLRTEHPEAVIHTELVKLDETYGAVFKATVSIPGGGEATGWGSETSQDFADFIEKAETKAIGRACAALGYGTQFTEDFDFHREDNGHVVDSPVEKPWAAAPKPEGASAGAAERPAAAASAGPALATPAQVKAIYIIARNEHQLSEEELDERSRQTYGAVPAQLTKRQASEFIDKLKGTAAAR